MSKKVINIRVWDVPVEKLCQKHLCAQWREGLAIWSILNNPESKSPYLNHPEVKRWKENGIKALWNKLYDTRKEAINRGYNFKFLPKVPDEDIKCLYRIKWQTTEQQIEILKAKGCKCKVK